VREHEFRLVDEHQMVGVVDQLHLRFWRPPTEPFDNRRTVVQVSFRSMIARTGMPLSASRSMLQRTERASRLARVDAAMAASYRR
jgi:hypothetical protein